MQMHGIGNKAKPDLKLYQAPDRINMAPHERALARAHMAQAEFLVVLFLDAGAAIHRTLDWLRLAPLRRIAKRESGARSRRNDLANMNMIFRVAIYMIIKLLHEYTIIRQ
jgi:hypothetical protein